MMKFEDLHISEGKEETRSNYIREKIHQKVKMGPSRDRLRSSTDKLMSLHEKFLKAEKNAVEKRCAVKSDYELESGKEKKVVCQLDTDILTSIYNNRSEIIKTIPNFWLTAFLSHYALGVLLTEEDHKIFKFLESLNVEDTEVVILEDTEVVIPGYTINFNFGDNPFFENKTLTKSVSYSSGGMDIRGSDIKWKGKKRGCSDDEISFFTWFSERDNSRWNPDEVAKLIIEDLWPNAIEYYMNGNLVNEEEDAVLQDCRLYLSCKEDLQKIHT